MIKQITKHSNKTGIRLIYTLNRLVKDTCKLLSYGVLNRFDTKMIFKIGESKILKDYQTQDFENNEYWLVKNNELPVKMKMPFFGENVVCIDELFPNSDK